MWCKNPTARALIRKAIQPETPLSVVSLSSTTSPRDPVEQRELEEKYADLVDTKQARSFVPCSLSVSTPTSMLLVAQRFV